MNIVRAVAERGVEAIARVNRWRRRGGESAFLVGVHVPITAEMDLADLRVTGTIPPALRGRYLKMGANPVRPDPASHHWFLGDGMVHGIALEDGRATWYRNRWILSRLAAPRSAARPRRAPAAAATTPSTPISSTSAANPSPSSKPAASPSPSPRRSTTSATPRSTARSPAPSPVTPTATRSPASTTPSPTTAASGTASATSCFPPKAGSPPSAPSP